MPDDHEDEISANGVRILFGPNLIKAILALAVLIAVLMGDSIDPSTFF